MHRAACRTAPPNSFLESVPMPASASTILVVEDDAIVRMLIVDVLEELEFSVLEADGSEAALSLLEDAGQHIDLLMTDVGLPGMNGRELAERARTLRPQLPVLFASGYAESIEVPAGMSVIGKPFSIDQLRDKVRSILG
ncbi:response regulator [Pseudomonas protegens CHA0]|uniref:Response regulator n=3 Tax=Pseudomonas protegens TaxID=380021 RepID=A0A2C9EN10_PSEPH|nr:response regulator [Pseudomonas protegens CHA0]